MTVTERSTAAVRAGDKEDTETAEGASVSPGLVETEAPAERTAAESTGRVANAPPFVVGGHKTPSTPVKRKATVNVSLLVFVQMLRRVAVDAVLRKGADVDEDTVAPYVQELTSDPDCVSHKLTKTSVGEAKRRKMGAHRPDIHQRTHARVVTTKTKTTTTVSCEDAKVNSAFDDLEPKMRRVIYLKMMHLLFVALERVNANLQFAREHLKYFLATHQDSVTVSDFVDTNQLSKASCQKQKTTSRLSNGAILTEYAKSKYMFASNLSRCDTADVDAIRYIVETGICVSKSIYRNLLDDLTDVPYIVDKTDTQRPDHVRIPIANAKRTAMMITDSVVLMYDGTQFVLPSPAVERDVTATMIASAQLKKKEYIVLDVLLASKLKVIDVIITNIAEFNEPMDYAKRLKLLSEKFHDVKTVSTNESKFDGSHIQKSVFSHTDPVYVYYKPNHTLAAVGLQNNTLLLAYEDDNGDLVYKLNAVNSGPASLSLGVVKLQPPVAPYTHNEGPDNVDTDGPSINKIDDNGVCRKVNILGLDVGPDVQLFSRSVRVEYKDGNKVGALSRSPVTNVSEYKALTPQKDVNLSLNNLTSFMNDPNNLESLIKAISKSTQFDTIIKHLQNDTVNTSALDLGY